MDDNEKFELERVESIKRLRKDDLFRKNSCEFVKKSGELRYSYNFNWMGMPIIQYPQDIVAMQEIIWQVKPDVIIETGVARGGSLIFYSSMLELIGKGRVLGIDIDIREHNLKNLQQHPLFHRISLFEGSSIDSNLVDKVRGEIRENDVVLVSLDSMHTHDHVLEELRLYSPLVTKGSYLVVFDTVIEDLPADFYPDRPWAPGNSPKTALHEFLSTNHRFKIDHNIDSKLGITVAPDGYLKCIG